MMGMDRGERYRTTREKEREREINSLCYLSVLLELALVNWTMRKLIERGWTPIITPGKRTRKEKEKKKKQ